MADDCNAHSEESQLAESAISGAAISLFKCVKVSHLLEKVCLSVKKVRGYLGFTNIRGMVRNAPSQYLELIRHLLKLSTRTHGRYLAYSTKPL